MDKIGVLDHLEDGIGQADDCALACAVPISIGDDGQHGGRGDRTALGHAEEAQIAEHKGKRDAHGAVDQRLGVKTLGGSRGR